MSKRSFMNQAVLMAITFLLVFNACSNLKEASDQKSVTVSIAGEMRDVMQRGDLATSIDLDTIQNKEHLYGVGPLDSLQGEITILDGKSYYSTLVNGEQIVRQGFAIKAPFFVYANVTTWNEIQVPDSVTTEIELEHFITSISKKTKEPFAFRITGRVDTARFHVVHLPSGTVIRSPADTHVGQRDYTLTSADVEILGFFSENHKGIFTHHDSNVHMHLITKDRKAMGHLDKLQLNSSTTLYIQD
jgi:acetolactate decarboxylase